MGNYAAHWPPIGRAAAKGGPKLIDWLTQHWKDLALVATGLVTAASVIVRLTPTKADDAVLNKVLSFLRIISLTPPESDPSAEPRRGRLAQAS